MTVHRLYRALVLTVALAAAPLPALAGEATDAFGKCLVGETTGNDRILLARWMTFAFAAHPAVQDAITVDATKADAANRDFAQLVTELVTQRCLTEARAAVAETGDPSVAMGSAFQVLGGAASQEAMQSPEVNASISAFAKYVDEAALTTALKP